MQINSPTLLAIPAANVSNPAAGGFTVFIDSSNSNKLSVKDSAGNVRAYTQKRTFNFGDGTATTFTITHNLDTLDFTWAVYDNSSNAPRYPDVRPATVNTATVSGYQTAPANNAFRIVIEG